MKASATNPRPPHQMTRAERAWSTHPMFVRHFEHRRYEAFTLRMGSVRYTPDFSGVHVHSGQLYLFEIKASDHRAAYTEAARLRLRTFACEYGELTFFVCWPAKGSKMREWVVTEVSNQTARLDSEIGPNFAQDAPDSSGRRIYQADIQDWRHGSPRHLAGDSGEVVSLENGVSKKGDAICRAIERKRSAPTVRRSGK